MACTITVQNTMNWATAFISQRLMAGVGGFSNEPALTSANLIYQTILNPPFSWQWNRNGVGYNTTAGTAQYIVSMPNFGYLERASVCDIAAVPPTISTYQLAIDLDLVQEGSPSNENARPDTICPFTDDNEGNISFLMSTTPDKVYNVSLIYQKAPALITSLSQTWAPIPDKYLSIYSRGFLAQMHAMYDANLYQQEMSLFLRQLVGVSEGLTETEKAIFLQDSMRKVETQAAAMKKG